jgi:hypothetical protein
MPCGHSLSMHIKSRNPSRSGLPRQRNRLLDLNVPGVTSLGKLWRNHVNILNLIGKCWHLIGVMVRPKSLVPSLVFLLKLSQIIIILLLLILLFSILTNPLENIVFDSWLILIVFLLIHIIDFIEDHLSLLISNIAVIYLRIHEPDWWGHVFCIILSDLFQCSRLHRLVVSIRCHMTIRWVCCGWAFSSSEQSSDFALRRIWYKLRN